MKLRHSGVQILGHVLAHPGALVRTEKAGASSVLLRFFESTFNTMKSSDEQGTAPAKLAPTVLADILRTTCAIAFSQRPVAITLCKNEQFIVRMLELCQSPDDGLQHAAVALAAVLASIQQCRPNLAQHDCFAALSPASMAIDADFDCKARCMGAMSFLLDEVFTRICSGGGAQDGGGGAAFSLSIQSSMSVLRQCQQAWVASGKEASLLRTVTATQAACMCLQKGMHGLAIVSGAVDGAVAQELQTWVLQLEQDLLPTRAHPYSSDPRSEGLRQVDRYLRSCLAGIADPPKPAQATRPTAQGGLGKLRPVADLIRILSKTSHVPHTRCICADGSMTCTAARLMAAQELLRWAVMEGGIDALLRARSTKDTSGPIIIDPISVVLLKCLRLSDKQVASPSALWQACARLMAKLLRCEVAVAQFIEHDGIALLMHVDELTLHRPAASAHFARLRWWRHEHDLVKGCVLDIIESLVGSSRGKMHIMRASRIRDVMMGGLNSVRHQEKTLHVLSSCWQPWALPSAAPTFPGDLECVSEAVLECVRRGLPRILGRMAIMLTSLLGSSSSFISKNATCLAAFVSGLCAVMGSCEVEEVVSFTRVLACSSAAGASRDVILAVDETVRASVERAAERSTDARLVDHALVLLRNVTSAEKSAVSQDARSAMRWTDMRAASRCMCRKSTAFLCVQGTWFGCCVASPRRHDTSVSCASSSQDTLPRALLCSPPRAMKRFSTFSVPPM